MFDTSSIEAIIRSNKNLALKLKAQGFYNLCHGTPASKALLGETGEEDLRAVAVEYGVDFDKAGHTYSIKVVEKDGKLQVNVYQPRLVLRKGSAMLHWGAEYVALKELAQRDNLQVQAQVIQGESDVRYGVLISSKFGDTYYPLYPKEGVELNTMQLTQAVKTGEGWVGILEAGFPTAMKSLISAEQPVFTFLAVGFKVNTRKGVNQQGQPYKYDEMIFDAEDGERYSAKVSRSQSTKDLNYWGTQATPENPIEITLRFEGIGIYAGAAYTQWGVCCRPVKEPEVSLEALFDLPDPMATLVTNSWGGVDNSITEDIEI